MNLLFYMALRTIPFGLAVAIEFPGPRWPWPSTTRAGRWTLSGWRWPWRAGPDFADRGVGAGGLVLEPVGIACAVGPAICWALYILLGQRLGGIPGGQAVSLGLVFAAMVVVPFGVAEAGAKLLQPSIPAFGLWGPSPAPCPIRWR
ncbi:Protein dispatched1 [Manis javanica]|nr:Protein dispatched1 [Manis javanica]